MANSTTGSNFGVSEDNNSVVPHGSNVMGDAQIVTDHRNTSEVFNNSADGSDSRQVTHHNSRIPRNMKILNRESILELIKATAFNPLAQVDGLPTVLPTALELATNSCCKLFELQSLTRSSLEQSLKALEKVRENNEIPRGMRVKRPQIHGKMFNNNDINQKIESVCRRHERVLLDLITEDRRQKLALCSSFDDPKQVINDACDIFCTNVHLWKQQSQACHRLKDLAFKRFNRHVEHVQVKQLNRCTLTLQRKLRLSHRNKKVEDLHRCVKTRDLVRHEVNNKFKMLTKRLSKKDKGHVKPHMSKKSRAPVKRGRGSTRQTGRARAPPRRKPLPRYKKARK